MSVVKITGSHCHDPGARRRAGFGERLLSSHTPRVISPALPAPRLRRQQRLQTLGTQTRHTHATWTPSCKDFAPPPFLQNFQTLLRAGLGAGLRLAAAQGTIS